MCAVQDEIEIRAWRALMHYNKIHVRLTESNGLDTSRIGHVSNQSLEPHYQMVFVTMDACSDT